MKFPPLLHAPFVLLVLSSCGEDGSAALERERERVELNHRLELAAYRLEQSRGVEEADREFRHLRTALAGTATKLDESRRLRARLEAEVAALDKDLDEYRTRVVGDFRRQWIGRTLDEIDTASGRTFKDVTIVSISDIGLTIRHRDGSARLGYADLTEEQRKNFALEPDAARLAEAREQEGLLAYERELDRQIAAQREIERRREAASPPPAVASNPRRTSSASAGDIALFASASPLSQPARPLGDGRRSYRVRNRSSSFYYFAPSCRTYSSGNVLNPRLPVRNSYVAPSCGSSRYTWLNPPTP